MKYGLIGEHLSHSYSCEIHAAIADYEYELRELPPHEVEGFLKKRDFSAINVTIPYKEKVIPFLDEISETAKKIGAVNTIVNKNGRLIGYNTDLKGVIGLVGHAGISLAGKKVLILGTGGTSKTVSAAAELLGAGEIIKVSRNKSDGVVTYSEAATLHKDAQIIFNTTPVGMYPDTERVPIDISLFPRLEGILDAIYHPLRTRLVVDGMMRGIPSCGGLYMLATQGVYASALFLGKEPDFSIADKVCRLIESEKQNIVLIGMPASGKSSIGKLLSQRTGREFVDSDDEITIKIKKSIPQFFSEFGEKAFRIQESEIIRQLSRREGAIIATGGGAVLAEENIYYLRQNGVIVFLDRSPEKLITTDDRPLSSNREALEKLYRERYQLYCKYADFHISSDLSVEEVTDNVRKELGI